MQKSLLLSVREVWVGTIDRYSAAAFMDDVMGKYHCYYYYLLEESWSLVVVLNLLLQSLQDLFGRSQ